MATTPAETVICRGSPVPPGHRQRRDGLPQVLGQFERTGPVRQRQPDAEFLAAHPAEHVRRPQAQAHRLGKSPQHQVTDQMAVFVVHPLEVVQIEQHQGHRCPLAPAAVQQVLQHRPGRRPVVATRQLVVRGELFHLPLRALEVGQQKAEADSDQCQKCRQERQALRPSGLHQIHIATRFHQGMCTACRQRGTAHAQHDGEGPQGRFKFPCISPQDMESGNQQQREPEAGHCRIVGVGRCVQSRPGHQKQSAAKEDPGGTRQVPLADELVQRLAIHREPHRHQTVAEQNRRTQRNPASQRNGQQAQEQQQAAVGPGAQLGSVGHERATRQKQIQHKHGVASHQGDQDSRQMDDGHTALADKLLWCRVAPRPACLLHALWPSRSIHQPELKISPWHP